MTHLDLFTGILGFSLAAQWVWGEEYELVACCEIDPFCQKVIRKHFPEVPIIEDIKKVKWVVADSTGQDDRRYNGESENGQIQEFGISDEQRITLPPIDLLTGGFPCQPASVAGKRAGTTDDRWLWPEMLRAIHEIKPRWVLAENVPGILSLQNGLVFEGACSNLETEGYEVQPIIIPACAIGAPHRRDRVWIVAHCQCQSVRGDSANVDGTKREDQDRSTLSRQFRNSVGSEDCHAPDPHRFNGNDAGYGSGEISQFKEAKISGCDFTNTHGKRLQVGEVFRRDIREERKTFIGNPWQEHWYEVATRLCRVDDGVSSRLDRLKSLGNAIVPQVAEVIFRAIKVVEEYKEDQCLSL
jgi:DNA (cytosine-5)-methyltransferase 1